MRVLTFAGLIIVLAATVSRGQYILPGMPEGEGPPMVATPMGGSSSAPPTPPFAPPPPTPLPPEQAAPMVPALPAPLGAGLEPPIPVVRLRVRAPARAEPDNEIEYRLTVVNVSNADAHHVVVRDRLPRGVDKYIRAKPEPTRQTEVKDKKATDLLWELGTLGAGQQKEIVLTIKPTGTTDIENRAYVQFEHGQKVTTRIAKPSVRVKVTVPAQAVLYESIPFRIEVANTGAIPLRNVIVTDKLPAGLEFVEGKPEPSIDEKLTWKVGDLLPQQTRRIDCQVISKQAGTFRNSVKVEGDGHASATDSAAVTVGEAKLKISISGPQRRLANRPIPYHIMVRNLGTMPVTNVQVSDELPGGIKFVKASEGGRKEGEIVRWSLGTLPPGARRSLLLVISAPKPRWWCLNQATVKADNNLSDKARSDWTYIDFADTPVVEIDKNMDFLDVGQKAIYTIRLVNPKKHAELRPSVLITVPDEMKIHSQRGPTSGQQEGQLVRFDPLQVLAPGEEKEYVVEVEARKAGEARLLARWTDGRQEPGPPENWEDKTIIFDSTRPASGVASAPREPSSGR